MRMEVEYTKKTKKKSGVFKKLKSYLSIWKAAASAKTRVTPTGWFLVHVGPEKERFVIKTECANHPLFKVLLEDAESEYGFRNEGPLHLPCDVGLFWKVLAEIDGDECQDFGYGCCSPFSPARISSGYGGCAYDRLTPPRMLMTNRF